MSVAQLRWLVRRVSRIRLAEVPHRLGVLARLYLQRWGWFDADPVPTRSAPPRPSAPWVKTPASFELDDPLLAEADLLMAGQLTVFGRLVPMPCGIPHWNRDPITGIEIPMTFGPTLDFRHVGHGVDIKFLWEVNRHLWWVRLAQAWTLTKDNRYLARLGYLIDDWIDSCPYARGPNWSSPVEHGLRLINWSIVWHLIGGDSSTLFAGAAGSALKDRWLGSVYQHIRFARDNYSFHSSADNHLIGEAAGVYVGALTWDYWGDVRRYGRVAKQLLEEECLKQFSADGVNREQAFCYQKFSLEFLLASALCGSAEGDEFSSSFWARLRAALLFVAAMTDVAGNVPSYGDSDDGRVFSLYPGSGHEALLELSRAIFADPNSVIDERRRVSTMSAIGWLVIPRPPASQRASSNWGALAHRFEQGGYVVLGDRLHESDELRILFDVGSLGYNRIAGHGHADALSVVMSYSGQPILIDPGTYCYNAAPVLRHYFRGTKAHNTVTVDERDQSVYGGSFLWLRDVNSSIHFVRDDGRRMEVEAAHDGYRRLRDPVTHVRRISLVRPDREFEVEDRLECAEEHTIEVHWHFAPGCTVNLDGSIARVSVGEMRLHVALPDSLEVSLVVGQEAPPLGWSSLSFYQRVASPSLVAKGRLCSERITTRFTFIKLGKP